MDDVRAVQLIPVAKLLDDIRDRDALIMVLLHKLGGSVMVTRDDAALVAGKYVSKRYDGDDIEFRLVDDVQQRLN